jgi:peptidoglycan lytic transglycosylase
MIRWVDARRRVVVATIVALAIGAAGFAAAQSEEGVANFYGDKFQGKKTTSGEVYDKNGLTAAHKKLPSR